MTAYRKIALCVLLAVCAGALIGSVLAPYPYDRQFRDSPNAPPSSGFFLGTDELGRDRFSRLLYATRTSIVLAPAASAISTGLALLMALLMAGSGRKGKPARAVFSSLTTVCLALPWIFLFIILRAELPLDTQPLTSVLITFGLMGVAGWAWPARIFAAEIEEIEKSGWLLQARAAGIPNSRIAWRFAWPHLRATAAAQFVLLIPTYIVAEASLGLLGLDVAEPMPSWGNLLKDLQHPDLVRANPWVLAPLVLLIVVMVCLETLHGQSGERA